MGELFTVPEDPTTEYGSFPGAVTNADGSVNPQEITKARPTGYLPDARALPQIPYDRDRDTQARIEWRDDRFPTEPDDSAELVDQHPMMHVTATITASDDYVRKTGTRDPMISGPARPDVLLLALHQYNGYGIDNTKYKDVPDGRQFSPYGSQDGTTWVIYQDATAALASFNDTGSPVPDDPSRTATAQPTLSRMAPGPAHGWTSTPLFNTKQRENDKALKHLRQQQSPHQDRKANSTVAGQTYSQRTQSVRQQAAGQAGSHADTPWW